MLQMQGNVLYSTAGTGNAGEPAYGTKGHVNMHIGPQWRKAAAAILAPLILMAVSACGDGGAAEPVAVIGNEGIAFARTIATQYPFRKAGSPEESAVAGLIEAQLRAFGYQPEIQECRDGDLSTVNVIVRIKGTGFETAVSGMASGTASAAVEKISRSVILGTHYDTPLGTEDIAKYPDYDGINDNASGVGALISVAKELRSRRNGYDVILVFFGAGHDDFLGARTFAASMSASDIASADAMYCVERIYAGDKLYAHAGLNSLEAGEKYLRRRKLYELSDVAIANSIDLRFNESDLDIDANSDGTEDVYREITTTRSDYSIFDEMDIPCVFMESFEYFESSAGAQTESKNPYFGETKGRISGTNYDSLGYLEEVFEADRLETRIKNSAFLLVEAIAKGMYR